MIQFVDSYAAVTDKKSSVFKLGVQDLTVFWGVFLSPFLPPNSTVSPLELWYARIVI